MRVAISVVLVAASTVGVYGWHLDAEESRLADDQVVEWVRTRVKDWQPTAADRRFDEIGWVADIGEALRLAREHNRPVFLFTHDGRMAIGRC